MVFVLTHNLPRESSLQSCDPWFLCGILPFIYKCAAVQSGHMNYKYCSVYTFWLSSGRVNCLTVYSTCESHSNDNNFPKTFVFGIAKFSLNPLVFWVVLLDTRSKHSPFINFLIRRFPLHLNAVKTSASILKLHSGGCMPLVTLKRWVQKYAGVSLLYVSILWLCAYMATRLPGYAPRGYIYRVSQKKRNPHK